MLNDVEYKLERWIEHNIPEQELNDISQKLSLNKLLAKLLLMRNIANKDLDKMRIFLNPSIELISDTSKITSLDELNKAITRIKQAIDSENKILVNGDPDADGITGTTILVAGLSFMNANIMFDFPIRSKEGHGLQPRIIESAHKMGIKLILTIDCGTKDAEAIAYAKNFGIDVIVIDHHIIAQDPGCYALVNPYTIKEHTEEQALSGSMLAFKFIVALAKDFQITIPEHLFNYLLCLGALGALSDRVSLLSSMNRIIIKKGLEVFPLIQHKGFKSLVKLAGLEDGIDLQPLEISKSILPRLNAPGRIGNWQENIPDSNFVVELLLLGTSDAEDENAEWFIRKLKDNFELEKKLLKREPGSQASLIEAINTERKKITSEIEDEIEKIFKNKKDFFEDKIIIIRGKDWNPGVIGIDADRIKERFLKPVIIITESKDSDYLRASVRSIPTLDIYSLLDKIATRFEEQKGRKLFCREVETEDGKRIVNSFGGHAQACGFTINKNDFEEFSDLVKKEVNALPKEKFAYNYDILETLVFDQLTPNFVRKIDQLAPFGQGFDFPIFQLKNCNVSNNPRSFGSKFQKAETPHVEFQVWQKSKNKKSLALKISAVGFGLWRKYKKLVLMEEHKYLDIIFYLELVKRRGRKSAGTDNYKLQLNVLDIKPAS